MNTTITLTQSPRLVELFGKLRNLPEVAVAAALRGMARGGQIVLGNAVRYRFTGKGPFPTAEHRLGVVTNRLRKSLRVTPPQVLGDRRTVRQSFGSNVSYFAIHEFGFKGPVPVRAHTRTTKSGKESNVRAHSRNLTIAARAPLTTELAEERTRKAYFVEIGRELSLALQAGKGGPV